MAKQKKIIVRGAEITLLPSSEEDDYISLADIAKQSSDEPRFVVRN